MASIYKITNKTNGKIYIGKTKQEIDIRWKEHKYKSRRSKRPLYKAINEAGIENFSIEKIEECPEDISDKREMFWIKHFNSYIGFEDSNGYNATLGGCGKPLCIDKEIIHLWENGKNIKEISETINRDDGNISKILRRLGVTHHQVEKRRCDSLKKSVLMIDQKTNETIKSFNSCYEAGMFINPKKYASVSINISRVCSGKRKTCYGYKWVYIQQIL